MVTLLSAADKARYDVLNEETIDFLMTRYNRVNRWVIADMLRRTRYHVPDKPALVFGDHCLSYTQLEAECNRVANALLDLGVKKYDRVAILAHNTLHHVLIWLGTAKTGGIYLALNYLLHGPDLAYCINHSESTVLIVEDSLYDLIKDVLAKLPTIKHLIWSTQGAGQPAPEGFQDFDAWYRSYPATEPEVVLRIEDPVQMTYTSGTESRPKGVILSNQALIAEYLACIIDGEYERTNINLNALPVYHCAQRDVFMNPIFWLGGTNILLGPDSRAILQAIASHRVTVFFAPPTVWIGLLRHPEFDQYDLSSLKKCYYGASIMPVEILKELLARLPQARVYNYYGQTELAPYHTLLKAEDALRKLGSAGRAGLHMETRLEADNGQIITSPGVPGEICGRGPQVMTLYFKEPDKTEEALKGDWFHSGDLGVLDEEGYVTVVDRIKDMIKTGGENVASREVEEAIYREPRVEEVAVIGLSNPKWIEAITAVIVPKPGVTLTAEEMLAHCRRELAPFKVPKKVIFVEALPKTPTGKILKRQLRLTLEHEAD